MLALLELELQALLSLLIGVLETELCKSSIRFEPSLALRNVFVLHLYVTMAIQHVLRIFSS